MNRFIANKTMYQRKEVSAAFVVKKQFNDGSEEGLAFLHAKAVSYTHLGRPAGGPRLGGRIGIFYEAAPQWGGRWT